MKLSVFIATSLDGFIARDDGSLDWLPGADGTGDDHGYDQFMATVDVLIMGRRTFETVLTFDEWPYPRTPVVVLSSQPVEIPEPLALAAEWMEADPTDVVRRLSARGIKHAYVDGGQTFQRFLTAGLINRITITRVPVLLGSGVPLFGPTASDIVLRHVQTQAFDDGLVQSVYDVVHEQVLGLRASV